MRRIKLLTGLMVGALVVGSGLIAWENHRQPSTSVQEPAAEQVTDKTTGLKLRYQAPLQAAAVSAADTQDKVVLRLTSIEPPMLITVRYEDGLRAVAAISKQEPLDIIAASRDLALPQRHPDYQQISQREFMVGTRPATEVIFTYKGPSGEKAQQRLLSIIKDGNVAVHVSAQSQASAFDQLNNSYFNPLFDSLSF